MLVHLLFYPSMIFEVFQLCCHSFVLYEKIWRVWAYTRNVSSHVKCRDFYIFFTDSRSIWVHSLERAVTGKDRAKSNVKWKKRLHYWLMKGGHAECSPRGISVASQITFVLYWFIIEINGKVYCWFMHELHSHLIGNGLKLSNEKMGYIWSRFAGKLSWDLAFFPHILPK